MRSALVVALLGMSCGGGDKPGEAPAAPAPPPVASAPMIAAAPAGAATWWCAWAGPRADEIAGCTPDEASCREASSPAVLHVPEGAISPCTRTDHAACVLLRHGDETREVCHPTLATCRVHVDGLSSDPRALGPCERKGAATEEPDVHWWCLTFGPEPMGLCTRSRERCEASRANVQRLSPSDKVSACAPQATARCTDVTNGDDHKLACAPNEPMCRTVAESQRLRGGRTSACHPVE